MTHDEQERLTRVGKGTPMGDLMRRYWIPAFPARELPDPDGPQMRIKLLGESLIAFRDTLGRVGLVSEACCHRGTSLFFGRNEECGLRCAYHGWKFDVTGQCVDLPQQPDYAAKVRITGYPCVERGDIVWTYMGPPAVQPSLPAMEWAAAPAGYSYSSRRLQENNWLQAVEGGMDNAHLSFVHKYEFAQDPLHNQTRSASYIIADPNPVYEVHPSGGGLTLFARREGDPGSYYYRVTQFLMPWYTFVPATGPHPLSAHAWVPMDDENTWTWSISFNTDKPLSEEDLEGMKAGLGLHVPYVPGTLRPLANKDNDYLMDRVAQKDRLRYSGVAGFAMQDQSLQESMGRILDRSIEHLIPTDRAILRARRRMLDAVADHQRGIDPPGLLPEHQRVRSAGMMLEKHVQVAEWAGEALRTGTDHPLYAL